MAERPVVLLGGDSRSTRVLFHALAATSGPPLTIIERPPSRLRLLQRRARRYGWPTVVGQVLFQAVIVPRLARRGRARIHEILDTAGLRDHPLSSDHRYDVPSANSQDAIALLRALDPAVVVVSGTRILGASVLSAVSAPFVNVHAGMTPAYRGVHGGYWALVSRDPDNCGATVHLVDTGIDTGPVLAQTVIRPTAQDSFATYPTLQLAAAVPLLLDSVRQVLAGESLKGRPPDTAAPSRYWTHPTLWGYLRSGVR